METYNKDEIEETIAQAQGRSREPDPQTQEAYDRLLVLVGEMTPYSDGDDLTDDDINAIDRVKNFIEHSRY